MTLSCHWMLWIKKKSLKKKWALRFAHEFRGSLGVWGFLTIGPPNPLSGDNDSFLGKVKMPLFWVWFPNLLLQAVWLICWAHFMQSGCGKWATYQEKKGVFWGFLMAFLRRGVCWAGTALALWRVCSVSDRKPRVSTIWWLLPGRKETDIYWSWIVQIVCQVLCMHYDFLILIKTPFYT